MLLHKIMRNDLELLAPAGDWERLEMALRYGADAVYLAGKEFGLRAAAGNFNNEELVKAIDELNCEKFGYTQEDPVRFQRLVQLFLSQQVDAMVAVPPAPDGNEELEEARRAGVPCVIPVLEEDPLAVASECAGRLLRLLNEIKTLSI